MTWVKLDDCLPDHAKVADLSDSAFRSYVQALCLCSRQLTDGRLTEGQLRQVMRRKSDRDELLSAGLFEANEGSGAVIHDYLEYQPSRAKVKARREAVSDRVRTHRSNGIVTPLPTRAETQDVTKLPSRPTPVPSRPADQDQISELRSSSSGKPDPALASSRAVFDCWRQEHGHPGAMFSAQRQARIKARFREGFTEEQLCLAIKQAKNDHYLMGVNDDGKRYDELESLLSKASKVERLLALTEPTKPNGRKDPKPMQANSNYDFAGAMK